MKHALAAGMMVLAMFCVVSPGFADSPPPDGKSLEPLSQEQRLQRVIVALRWRERQYDNFIAEFTDSSWSVNAKTGERVGEVRQLGYRLVRSGAKMFSTQKALSGPAETRFESANATDGQTSRNYSFRPSSAVRGGYISGGDPYPLHTTFFRLQGLMLDSLPMPLSDWASQRLDRGVLGATVSLEPLADRPCVVLKTKAKAGPQSPFLYPDYAFWFDSERDWMLVRVTQTQGGTSSTRDFTDARQVDGLWVAKKYKQRREFGGRAPEIESAGEVTLFERGKVKDANLAFAFPAGTRVSDEIRHYTYRIAKDGSEQPFPHLDQRTGRYTLGPQPLEAPATPRIIAPTTRGVPSSMSMAEQLEMRRRVGEPMVQRTRPTTQALPPDLIATIRSALDANPKDAVDKLNREWVARLAASGQYEQADQFVIEACILVARDTWPLEQLYRTRVRNLAQAGRSKEALAAAKALFNVGGMGSISDNLEIISTYLPPVYPREPGIVFRFRLQQLALAQLDEKGRQAAWEGLGEPILDGIAIDPAPYKDAIAQRLAASPETFNQLYGAGNLLLLSGRVKEARTVFEKAYKIAPPSETAYASEAIAKLIKAEDGGVGRANAWIISIRPEE